MSDPVKTSRGEWYFSHILAGSALITVAIVLVMQSYLDATHSETVEFPTIVSWVLGICVFGMMWFWIRMITDFFRERPPRNPALWGWALLLGFVFGGLAYFWVVWRPRHRPS